jgi:putative membrane protein
MSTAGVSIKTRLEAALGIALRGFLMGAADVVPGVSGGTMAFILGIYTRFIDAIKSFDMAWLAAVLRGDWRAALTRPHFEFVVPLLTGIVSAVLFFTHVVPLPRLLETHPEQVYGLFFGLVAGSVVALLGDIGGLRPRDLPALLGGVALGAVVVTAVPTTTPETWWFVMLSGALAICAMVVPGISGSFVLLLLGKYAYVLDAVGHLRFGVILPFVAGIVVGLASFTRLLSWFLHRHERAALVAITGVLVASLWVIWPFQARRYVEVRGKQRLVESLPQWPEATTATWTALALAVFGVLLVVILHRVARRGGALVR